MEMTEIIKNALLFPSKNLETLSIYAILIVLSAAFTFEGIMTVIFGIMKWDILDIVIGAIYIIVAIIMGLITRRISIQCIKTGVEMEDYFPDFKWWDSLGTGFGKIVISVVYFILPGLIVLFIALITNVFGNLISIGEAIVAQTPYVIMGKAVLEDAIFQSAFPLFVSLALTFSLGIIVILVCSFFQSMSEARFAHTGSLKNALNLYGAAKDITRIGIGKLLLLSLLIFVIVVCIEGVLVVIFDHLIVLSILNIIITPYIALFTHRALGLLYSDIV